MRELRWVKTQLGTSITWFYFALILGVISSGLYVCFPFTLRKITEIITESGGEEELSAFLHLLPPLLLFLVGTQFARSVIRYFMLFILEKVSQNLLIRVKSEIYENLCRQDDEFYHQHTTGHLMTCLTADLDLVRHAVAWISYNVVENFAFFLFASVYFFQINRTLALSLLLITPIILVLSYFYAKSVHPYYVDLRERLSTMNTVTQENIAGNKTVRTFVREAYEREKFAQCNENYRETSLKANGHWLKFFPIIELFSQSLLLITMFLGGWLIIQGQMALADLTAFTLLIWGISEPMKNLGVYINDFQRFCASTQKVMSVYYAQPDITSPEKAVKTPPERGTLRFENVSMRYEEDEEIVLENISFSLKTGETLGIIGATGSGKTTLIRLITRSIQATEGDIFVDGISVKEWDLQELRSRVSQATQSVGLHSESVSANIAYHSPDLPLNQVKQWAHLASAHFVEELPEQFDTIIGEMGMGLSGGQKQRIALARALAKQGEFLILDDTTSAVDTETERELWENLNKLPYACTKILIAQRISAIKNADLILVLEDGKIIQEGTHETLKLQPGIYQEICQLQGVDGL